MRMVGFGLLTSSEGRVGWRRIGFSFRLSSRPVKNWLPLRTCELSSFVMRAVWKVSACMHEVGAMMGVSSKDTIYTCLPIFHSAGGGLGVGAMIVTGATLALSRKFSTQRFWKEAGSQQEGRRD